MNVMVDATEGAVTSAASFLAYILRTGPDATAVVK